MRSGCERQSCNKRAISKSPSGFTMKPRGRFATALGAAAGRMWNVGLAFAGGLRTRRPSIFLFRALIDPTARRILADRYGADGHAILDQIWTDVAERWGKLPPQTTLGATITVRLAAMTATAYETLFAKTNSAQTATQCVYDIAWALYKKLGTAAWMTSGILSRNRARRLRLATTAFRTFPFSAPSYVWEDVPAPEGGVSFNCLHCPVADYFKTQHLSELCVRTWCALDFPLAANVWNAGLIRSGSIAGGASTCDFRWQTQESATERAEPKPTASV
jgi:ubiquinone biosynthesis protein